MKRLFKSVKMISIIGIIIIGTVANVGAWFFDINEGFYDKRSIHDIPQIWFGKQELKTGEAFPNDTDIIKRFYVNISNKTLNEFHGRLDSTRFGNSIVDSAFNYGFNAEYLRKVVKHWKTSYDWRKQESDINKLNQFVTQINGLKIHFIHVKPLKPAQTVVPILILHGWPGSFWMYYKLIEHLNQQNTNVSFEVICPSIPGFGFSEAPKKKGFDIIQTAHIFMKLMNRLQHKKFFVYAEDWGTVISHTISHLYPTTIRGLYSTRTAGCFWRGGNVFTYFVGMLFPSLVFDNPLTDFYKLYPFFDKFILMLREFGYNLIQMTKPDTVGAALVDSPAGLAAYMLEKFSTWTDHSNVQKADGGLTKTYTLDELLTNVMIYWFSNNVISSMRYFKENAFVVYKVENMGVSWGTPVALADFPRDFVRWPRVMSKHFYYNLIQYTEMPRGGHFPAFEEPLLVSDDFKPFVNKVLIKEKETEEREKQWAQPKQIHV